MILWRPNVTPWRPHLSLFISPPSQSRFLQACSNGAPLCCRSVEAAPVPGGAPEPGPGGGRRRPVGQLHPQLPDAHHPDGAGGAGLGRPIAAPGPHSTSTVQMSLPQTVWFVPIRSLPFTVIAAAFRPARATLAPPWRPDAVLTARRCVSFTT